MSWGSVTALALVKDDGGGPGLRAALSAPRGVEEAVIAAVARESALVRKEGRRIGWGLGGNWAKSSTLTPEEVELENAESRGGDCSGAVGDELMFVFATKGERWVEVVEEKILKETDKNGQI